MVWSYSRVGGTSIRRLDSELRMLMLTMSLAVSTNSARDVGARLMALTIWGREAGGGSYAAITALTNIPATLLAAVFYEAVFADYNRSE